MRSLRFVLLALLAAAAIAAACSGDGPNPIGEPSPPVTDQSDTAQTPREDGLLAYTVVRLGA